MQQYTLTIPRQVYSGPAGMDALAFLAAGHSRAAVFTDPGIQASGVLDLPLAQLDKANVPYTIFNDLPAEPTCDQAQQAIDRFYRSKADLIVAVGGGSVMDIAKLASITSESCPVRRQLDAPTLGKKQVFSIMIPTTAGTGSEATPISMVTVPENQPTAGIVTPQLFV